MSDYILPWVDLVSLKAPKATPSPKPCDRGRQMSSFSDTQQSCLVQKTGGVATLQMEMYFTGWCERWWAESRKRWPFYQMRSKWATKWRLSTCHYIMQSSWSLSLFVVNSWDRMEDVYLSVTCMRSKPSTACFRYYQEQQMAVVLIIQGDFVYRRKNAFYMCTTCNTDTSQHTLQFVVHSRPQTWF